MSPSKLISGSLTLFAFCIAASAWADEPSGAIYDGKNGSGSGSAFIPLSNRAPETMIPLSGRTPGMVDDSSPSMMLNQGGGPVWASPVDGKTLPRTGAKVDQPPQNRFWAPPKEFKGGGQRVQTSPAPSRSAPSRQLSSQGGVVWSAHPPAGASWGSGGSTPRMASEHDDRFDYSEPDVLPDWGGSASQPRMADENDARFDYSEPGGYQMGNYGYQDPVEYRQPLQQQPTQPANRWKPDDRFDYNSPSEDYRSGGSSVWDGEPAAMRPRRSKRYDQYDNLYGGQGRRLPEYYDGGSRSYGDNLYNEVETTLPGTYGNQWQ